MRRARNRAQTALRFENLRSIRVGTIPELHRCMLHTSESNSTTFLPSSSSNSLFLSVLENTEAGVAVVNSMGQAVYLNSSLQTMMAASSSQMPAWSREPLIQMIEQIRACGQQVVEKWCHEDTTYRVRGRSLDEWGGHYTLEITVACSGKNVAIADSLAKSLSLSASDAALLELLWRGMSNEEIAETQQVRIGTVKSRLFRLYQKLGVRRRPAAVLRAAEVIAQ